MPLNGGHGPYDVLLDNQANANVFHQRDLLHAFQGVDEVCIGGITADPRMSSSNARQIVGTDIDNVMYFEEASANVLSLSLTARSFQIQWNQEYRRFNLFGGDGQQFIFQERNGLYICDFSPLLDARIDHGLLTTV